jgi:hypothetical protein
MLHHPGNDHWHEWREAVKSTGYTPQLAHAARVLLELETWTVSEFDRLSIAMMEGRVPCMCLATTNIADEINFGMGKLDEFGFWEFPCTHRKKTA